VNNHKKDLLFAIGKSPIIAFVIALLIAVLVSAFLVQPALDNTYREKIINDAADHLQLRTNFRQQSVLSHTRDLATDIGLGQLVEEGDPTRISQAEAGIRDSMPHAIRVRLIPIGKARVDRDSTPPFTFTSLDLVNQVEAGQQVNPETINIDGQWLLSIAAPISSPSTKVILGTLFIYFDMGVIRDGIDSGSTGAVRVMQSVNNAPPIEILSAGSPIDNTPISRPLDNPNWTLLFYPNAALSEASPASLLMYLLPTLAALLVALTGTIIGVLGFLKSLDSDLETLTQQIHDVASRKFQPTKAYRQPGFLALDDGLASITTESGKPRPPAAVANKANAARQLASPAFDDLDIDLLDESDLLDADELEDIDSRSSNEDLRSIFRAYDIRGIVGESLTPDVIYDIGRAIGSEALDIGEHALLVGADGRLSSPDVMTRLIDGILDTGVDVISIGTVPTPVLYFGTQTSDTHSGVMVTASHNPAEYNGFKIVFNDQSLVEEDIQRLYNRVDQKNFHSGKGEFHELNLHGEYMNAIADDIVVAQPLRVVVDCGNGIAGEITPEIYISLGCEVIPLYCEVDGSFPNHPPDPSVANNLEDLVLLVKSQKADLGIALDGDGDRMVAVTSSGQIVSPDDLLMLFAKDVVSRNPGSDVVYDVKCTRNLNSVISGFGGRPIICRSGHSYLKEKMSETDAALGGEYSGHICFSERWYGFDDGIYAGARLLEIVGSQTAGLDELMEEFPKSVSTPEIKLFVSERDKFSFIDNIVNNGEFGDGTITTIDGIRVDYADGWGLVRASNTGPCLTLRFEADNVDSLDRIRELFQQQLHKVDSSLTF